MGAASVSTRTIPGVLDLHALDLLTGRDRPADTAQLQAEACRLHLSGHSAVWIAESLRIDLRQVERWLRASP